MLKSENATKMKQEGMAEVKMPDGQTLELPVLSVRTIRMLQPQDDLCSNAVLAVF